MVPITITIVPRILVAPRHLDFGNIDHAAGPPVTRYVIIKRFDGKKLESPIRSVCPPGIEVKDETPATVPSLDIRKFRIVYHPRESVKPLTGCLSFWLPDNTGPFTVSLSGTALPTAAASRLGKEVKP